MNSAARKSSDDLLIVHQGATVSDLSVIFDMSPQEVNRRIVGKVVPKTVASKIPRYALREAAPYLCNVIFDPEEFIKKMAPEKLPPKLQDAFWKAQRSRLAYEEDKGDLWRTERVIGVLSDAFKAIRMTVLMFGDTLEQVTEITPEQRTLIQELGDGMLASLHTNLIAAFANYQPPADEHGMPLSGHEGEMEVPQQESEDFDDGFGDD